MTDYLRDPRDVREEQEALIERELNPDFALISDYTAGELSEEQAKHVRVRLESDPEFRDLAEPLLLAWSVPPKTKPMSHDELQRSWLQLRRRAGMPPVEGQLEVGDKDDLSAFYKRRQRARRKSTTRRVLLIAAMVAYIIALPVALTQWQYWRHWVTVETVAPNTTIVPLPDGSRVTVSGGSWLRHRKDFTTRTVQFRGEGTFEVPGPYHGAPFIVRTESARITVTGTSFTVTAYAGGPTTVTVRHGKVKLEAIVNDDDISDVKFGPPLTLHAGQRGRAFKHQQPEILP